MGIEYLTLSLKNLIKRSIEDTLEKKDWEIVAIDLQEDKLVLKRYEDSK